MPIRDFLKAHWGWIPTFYIISDKIVAYTTTTADDAMLKLIKDIIAAIIGGA
jgi:hypothetical protein